MRKRPPPGWSEDAKAAIGATACDDACHGCSYEALGPSDDAMDADGRAALSYTQAQAKVRTYIRARLIGVWAAGHFDARSNQNPKIEPDAPIVYVVEVEFNTASHELQS